MASAPVPTPIFVVGYVHTGTTLLRSVLGKHTDIFMMFGESHFFEDLVRIRRDFPRLQDELVLRDYIEFVVRLAMSGSKRALKIRGGHGLAEIGLSREQIEALIDAARQSVAASSGSGHIAAFRSTIAYLSCAANATRWLEKTPAHVHRIDEILAALPDARIIELVRDPRAALASRKARAEEHWRATQAAAGAILNQRIIFDPVFDSHNWRAAVRAGARAAQRHPHAVLRIRYEDLVDNPTSSISDICQFVGIDFQPQMLQVGWVNSTTQARARADGPAGIGQSALGKWRQSLTRGEIAVIQMFLRKDLASLGYEPVSVGWRGGLQTAAVLCRSVPRTIRRISARGAPGFEHRWRSKLRLVRQNLAGRAEN